MAGLALPRGTQTRETIHAYLYFQSRGEQNIPQPAHSLPLTSLPLLSPLRHDGNILGCTQGPMPSPQHPATIDLYGDAYWASHLKEAGGWSQHKSQQNVEKLSALRPKVDHYDEPVEELNGE